MKPVSTGVPSQSIVLLWPPIFGPASNNVTACLRDSNHAAPRPDMPLPTTAMARRFSGGCGDRYICAPGSARLLELWYGRVSAWDQKKMGPKRHLRKKMP